MIELDHKSDDFGDDDQHTTKEDDSVTKSALPTKFVIGKLIFGLFVVDISIRGHCYLSPEKCGLN